MPSQPLNNLLTVVSVACALTVTSLLVRRELFPRRSPANEPVKLSATEWAAVSEGGESLGPPNARVRIVVFADFQCPACRDFADGPLRQVRQRHSAFVEVRFRDWPLPYHPLAVDLAVQARCAGRQGKFWAYHDQLFESQDTILRASSSTLAIRAQVPDTNRWRACLSEDLVRRQIASDAALAKSIKASGTPTVIIDGYKYQGFPDAAELERVIARAIR